MKAIISQQIISEFRHKYIKEGIFPVEISDMIGNAFEIRNISDYDDMFIAGKNETEEQISNAETVLQTIQEFLQQEEII